MFKAYDIDDLVGLNNVNVEKDGLFLPALTSKPIKSSVSHDIAKQESIPVGMRIAF